MVRSMQLAVAAISTAASYNLAQAAESAEIFGGSLTYNGLIQLHGQKAKLSESDVNPDNVIGRLPDQNFSLELRPNINFSTDLVELRLSPRAKVQRNRVVIGGTEMISTGQRAYINEWGIRITPNDLFSVRVGRQVLLWGAAQSESPSNPLYADNGRANPYLELGGKDLLELAWFPSANWTISYIDNYGQGISDAPPLESFHRTRLMKLDFTGQSARAGVNFARIDGKPAQIGFNVQATLSEALLLYAEGGYSRRPVQYRPQVDANGRWDLAIPGAGSGVYGVSVVGAAYTLQAGPTVTVEYLYNNEGWSKSETNTYFALAVDAASTVSRGGLLAMDAASLLARGAYPGRQLQSRNYLFIQYAHQNLTKNLDFTVRLTHNMNDKSVRVVPILEQRLGDRFKLVALGMFTGGGARKEFASYLSRQWFVGLNSIF